MTLRRVCAQRDLPETTDWSEGTLKNPTESKDALYAVGRRMREMGITEGFCTGNSPIESEDSSEEHVIE